jgi:hypothetical protein
VIFYIAVAILFGVLAVRWFASWRDDRREIARLRQPVDPSVGVTPQATNQAVLMYVLGFPRQDVPGDHPDAVRARFGATAPLLLAGVDRLLGEASRCRDLARDGDDPEGATARRLREDNPELTADAAHALAAWALARGDAAAG